MATYIPLGKKPESPEERQKLLAEKDAEAERLSGLEITHVQRRVIDFLTAHKGYSPGEIEVNAEFRVELQEGAFRVKADIIVKPGGVRLMVIKCAMNSLESWERHSVAFCRIVDSYQIPFAVITDGEATRKINVLEGGVVGGELDAIPSREEAQAIIRELVRAPYPEEKREKEKRILYAFDAIKCPTNLSKSE